MSSMFRFVIEGGQGYIKLVRPGGVDGRGALFEGAASPGEFSAQIDFLIQNLERVRAEGVRQLEIESAKPLNLEIANEPKGDI